jgi:hypothetical protein
MVGELTIITNLTGFAEVLVQVALKGVDLVVTVCYKE